MALKTGKMKPDGNINEAFVVWVILTGRMHATHAECALHTIGK